MNTTASSRSSPSAASLNPLTREVARSNAAAASGSSATFVAFLASQVGGAGTMFDRAAPLDPPSRDSAQPERDADRSTEGDAAGESEDAEPRDSREPAQSPRSDRAPATKPVPGEVSGLIPEAALPDAPSASPAPDEPAMNPSSGHPALTRADRRAGPQTISPKATSKDAASEPAAPTDPLCLIPGRSGPTPPAESRASGDQAGAQAAAPSAPSEAAPISGPRFSEHLSTSAAATAESASSAAAQGEPAPNASTTNSAGAPAGSGASATAPSAAASASAASSNANTPRASNSSGNSPGTAPGTPLVGIAAASGIGPLGKLVGTPLGTASGPRLTAQEAETQGQVARGLASALKAQNGEVTLRLTPDTLGTVRITLRIEDQQVRATIETSTLAARDLLSKGVESLRAGLERRGLEVDRLEVRATPEALPTAPPARSDAGTSHEHPPRDFSHGGSGGGAGGGAGGGDGGGGEHAGEDRRNTAGTRPHGLVGDDAANSVSPRGDVGLLNLGPTLSLERDGSATTLPDGRTVQSLRLEAVA